jgi:hypothetical protein
MSCPDRRGIKQVMRMSNFLPTSARYRTSSDLMAATESSPHFASLDTAS